MYRLYIPNQVKYDGNVETFMAQMDHNWNKLMRLDWQAKQEGSLVGRVISHPFADGYANYQVIKENKRTVVIRVCTGLGDDWVLPAWGEKATIKKDWAIDWLNRKDGLDELFGGHPADPHREAKMVRVNGCKCSECQRRGDTNGNNNL